MKNKIKFQIFTIENIGTQKTMKGNNSEVIDSFALGCTATSSQWGYSHTPVPSTVAVLRLMPGWCKI